MSSQAPMPTASPSPSTTRSTPRTVVAYDPNTDISVLDVPGLDAPPLSFAESAAPTGTDALITWLPGRRAF